MSKDQLLSDPAPATVSDADDFIDDVPAPEVDPADYDFGAMVAGVRPNRVRVRIRPRSDLYPRLQELAEDIDAYPADEDVPADLADEWADLKARYDKTFVVVMEGRSTDWVKNLMRELKKRGINPGRKGLSDDQATEHLKQQVAAQIAAQIVHPTQGVTAAAVEALYEANEAEADKLFRALNRVNKSVSGVAPDFSRRLSPDSLSG